MIQITSDMVTAVSTAAITLAGGIPLFSAFAKKWGPIIQKDAPVIAEAADGVVHVVEDALKLPKIAALETELAAKVDALKKSEMAKVASTALHAFEKGLGALTPNEKVTLVAFIRSHLDKLGINATDAEVLNTLNVAQKVADDFKATDAFKNTVALEASLQALQVAQTQPTPDTATAQ